MKIPEILGASNIFEVLETNDRKAIQPIKPIKPIKPYAETIKPIGPKPPVTPEQFRMQSRKKDVERAQENLKKERITQMQRKK